MQHSFCKFAETSTDCDITFEFNDRFGSPDNEAQSNTLPIGGELNGGLQTFAFASKVTNAAPFNHQAYTQFDYYTGKPVNGEDANAVVAKGSYSDALDRATELVVAVNQPALSRRTAFTYNDAAKTITTQSDQTTYNDQALKGEALYDGLGRTIEARQYESAAAYIKTTTSFDGLGRQAQVSNPYRSGEPLYYTTTTYDGLSRVKTVTPPDNAVVTSTYAANATTVTDQAGKLRRSVSDGLGRLIRVDEPDASGNLGLVTAPTQPTSYTYDALDNLARVQQGSQNRYFFYDSLKRLLRSYNPEQNVNSALTLTDPLTGNSQWNQSYSYDNNSNLTQKVDARNLSTTYTYDALNRATFRDYSDTTPDVTYTYDDSLVSYSKGRLTKVSNSLSVSDYSQFDALGRVLQSKQTTTVSGTNYPYTIGYSYNLAGAMLTQTYPSGRVVATDYDAAGRIAGVKHPASGNYYVGAPASDTVNRLQYTAHDAVSAMKLGNGKWEHTTFNSRLQPTQIGLGTSSTNSSLLQLDYGYGTTTNNGNVLTQRILVNALDVTQTYTYDEVNRLKTAEEKQTSTQTQIWKQAFTFDRYGNRNFDVANTTANVLGANPTISQTNNRFNSGQSYSYDTAGNVTAEPGNKSYTYDAENHQLSFTLTSTTTNYGYDGDGKRVRKANPDGTTIVYVYNAMGQMLAEYTTGTASGTSGTSYITADHLGSTRVVTKADGTVRARYDFLPFGEEIAASIGGRSGAGYVTDSTRQKFTGHERDSESGLDFAQARYCSSATGRFMSPDPLLQSAINNDPQTWNRYTYVQNNPLRYIDPDGKAQGDVFKRTKTTTTEIVAQERGGGQAVQQAKITITETQVEYLTDKGKVFYKEPIQTTATAINTGKAPRDYSDSDLRTMENVAVNVIEVSREKGFDQTIALGIANLETHMGVLPSKENVEWKKSDINPMQLSEGAAKGGTLRSNISGAIDLYNSKSGSTLHEKLANYRGKGQPDTEAYASSGERKIDAIRSSRQESSSTTYTLSPPYYPIRRWTP